MEYPPTSIIAIAVVLPLLAAIAVGLRLWVRVKVAPAYLGADDWLAIGAAVFALADGANLIVGTTLGFTGHVFEDGIPPDRYIAGNKFIYSQVIIEKPLYAMTKLSALFFFRRIFLVQDHFRAATNLLIAFISVWAGAFLLVEIFACGTHPEQLWTPGNARAGCVPSSKVNLAFAITDSILDIAVVVLPYPSLRRLHVARREKLGLIGLFLLGVLGTVASFVRLGIIVQAAPHNYDGPGNTHGANSGPDVWSTVEGSIGVLAVCLTPLAPLIRGRAINFGSRITWGRRASEGEGGSGKQQGSSANVRANSGVYGMNTIESGGHARRPSEWGLLETQASTSFGTLISAKAVASVYEHDDEVQDGEREKGGTRDDTTMV